MQYRLSAGNHRQRSFSAITSEETIAVSSITDGIEERCSANVDGRLNTLDEHRERLALNTLTERIARVQPSADVRFIREDQGYDITHD